MRLRFACMLAALLLTAPPLPVSAEGTVVVARAARDPVIVWDATQEVYEMVGQGTPERDVNSRVARDALRAARSKAAALRSASGRLTVRIVFQESMTPSGTAYKVATLQNASLYATLQLPVAELNRASAASSFRVVGRLPGR